MKNMSNIDLKPCPFCGGKARISHREYRYKGINGYGVKLIKTAFYGMCNKCKATGSKIFEDIHYWNGNTGEEIEKASIKAAKAWNRRADNE